MPVKANEMKLYLQDRVRHGRSFQVDNDGFVTRHSKQIEHENEVRDHYYKRESEPKGYPRRGSADNPFNLKGAQKDISLTGVDFISQSMIDSTSGDFEKKVISEPENYSDFEERKIREHLARNRRRMREKEKKAEKQVQHVNIDSTEIDTDEAARLECARKKRAAQAGEEYKSFQSGINLNKIRAMERILEKGGLGGADFASFRLYSNKYYGIDPSDMTDEERHEVYESFKESKRRGTEKLFQPNFEKNVLDGIVRGRMRSLPGEPKKKSVEAYKEWMRRGTGKEDWEGLFRDEEKASKRRKAAEMMGFGTYQEAGSNLDPGEKGKRYKYKEDE